MIIFMRCSAMGSECVFPGSSSASRGPWPGRTGAPALSGPDAVASAELLPGRASMLAFLPPDDLFPEVGPQVAEGRMRAAVLEVRGPAPQHPVELMQQDPERLVRVLPAHYFDLRHDRGQRFLGRVDVDVAFADPSFPVSLDAPAQKVEALIDVGDQSLFRRRRKPIADRTSAISSRKASACTLVPDTSRHQSSAYRARR